MMNSTLSAFFHLAFAGAFTNAVASRREAFLFDYFKNKPYMLTMNVCWSYSEIHSFLLNDAYMTQPKLIAIYRNQSQTHFMNHLSANNYFLLDTRNECISSWNILAHVNESLVFRFPLKFMLLVDDVSDERLINALSRYAILPSTDLIVVQEGGDQENFELWQPYRIDMNQPIIWENYGIWNESQGFYSFLNMTELQTRRHDFQGTTKNIGFYIEFEETWQHLEDFRRPRVDTFTKQNFGAIKSLMEYCNITMVMVPVKIWGYYNETTNTWNGLVDMVSKGNVVLAGSSPYFTIERLQVVDFVKMQNHLEIKFIMMKPPLSYMYNIYTLPFQSNVWKAILVIILLFFAGTYVILNWEARRIAEINNQTKITPSDVSLMMCEAVCQQGTTTEVRTITGRIIEFIMYLCFFFLYSSYSAYIVVILQSTHTIANYQELYDSNMRAGGMETTYMRVYLAGSKNKLQQKIYEKKIGPKGFYPLEEGIRRVQEGFFAFHAEVSASYNYIAQTFTDYDICNLQIMEGYNSYMKGYTMLPKNSPYKEVFKVGLMKIDEYGIQKRNYIRLAAKPVCHSGGGTFKSVGIIDIQNALFILAGGIGVAVGVMLLECVYHKRPMRIARSDRSTLIGKRYANGGTARGGPPQPKGISKCTVT